MKPLSKHSFTWETWGPAALNRAQTERKPILLHIGASWCHWCHVMDEGSYPDREVGPLIQSHFVAIRVDTDARPDLNERYNQGGWPTIAILDPQTGQVLVGRTYLTAFELRALLQGFTGNTRWSSEPAPPVLPPPSPADNAAILVAVERAYDPYHGGFGDYEKFPHLPVCEWLLDRSLRSNTLDPRLERSLDAMCDHELYDTEEGGFFRYCMRDDWASPHYEKMLEDNAAFISLYLRAWRFKNKATWRQAAEGALHWAIKHLYNDIGGHFGGSQDADAAYYQQALPARLNPPAVDTQFYAGWNGRMVESLVRAWASLDRPGLLGLALIVGERLLSTVGPAVARGPEGVSGLLEDHAGVALGLLALYQATGQEMWLKGAQGALEGAWERLRHPEGGILDREAEGYGLLKVPLRPLMAGALYADACRRFAALSGEWSWQKRAQEICEAGLLDAGRYDFMGAAWAAAHERAFATVVVVKGSEGALIREIIAGAHPDILGRISTDPALTSGKVMACNARACGRPTLDRAVLDRDLVALALADSP